MAADSDGCDLTTVVTCEGDLADPRFAGRFEAVVDRLNAILGDVVKVHKLEPWNSVRVTLSIPREAALRLRKLATEGAAQLRALGILSVQVEGDQVISLRIANAVNNAEPQEIRLQTTQDGSSSSVDGGPLARFLGAAPEEPPVVEKVQFKSPNVVCPADSVVPKVPVSVACATSSAPPTTKSGYGPFPFTSMNQAIHSQVNYTPPPPPPPYPGKHPAVTISSPLLVNLLQNDGAAAPKSATPETLPVSNSNNSAVKVVANRTVNAFVQKPNLPRTITARTVPLKNTKPPPPPPTPSQASTSSSSPSALSNTSIRQNSKPNSTISNVTLPAYPTTQLPPPPPYSVAVNNRQSSDSLVQTSPFMDLIPSLTDLKADDLEHLLPTLERDLARSPPEIPEELTTTQRRSEDKRNFLINPLTGELEPQSSGGESDVDDLLGDVFTGLPSPAAISDEDTNSTIRPDTTDQSDSETRSSHSDSGKHSRVKSKTTTTRDRGRDSPGLKPTEKIKLRLKLEKSEPINSAYKVDVSFIQQPKKASVAATTPPGEELRVPPLHISLRGRHHAFITNKKKKLNPDKPKMRKTQDVGKIKKSSSSSDHNSAIANDELPEDKKKKFKSNHEHDSTDLVSKLVIHNSSHYKEKQKERRGSDSELTRANLKFVDSNGIVSVEKRRRLSQSEPGMSLRVDAPPILGSTNVGTIAGLKPRKDKSNKVKDLFKNKEGARSSSKSFAKGIGEKFGKQQQQQVALPTGEMDMEAKFKQRLMEGSEKGIPRPPHRTMAAEAAVVHQILNAENNQIDKSEQVIKTESEPPPLKEKSPEPDKCNTPDRKQADLGDKQSGRSPNGGAQGEDSGIESMDALSEKSPNQASQSPHDADIIIPEAPPSSTTLTNCNNSNGGGGVGNGDSKSSKTQVPEMPDDMLDIEAQLAKMEGLNGVEDMNESNHNSAGCGGGAKKQLVGGPCCELTSALQDSLKQGAVTLTTTTTPMAGKEQMPTADVTMVPVVKSKTKEDDLEPLPVRVAPPLYTYSNPDKTTRAGSETPTTLSDDGGDEDDSNSSSANVIHNASTIHNPTTTAAATTTTGSSSSSIISNNSIAASTTPTTTNKTKSLLEQLLIEIPDAQTTPSSPSPATRSSVRTRALSKLNSPELNSPNSGAATAAAKSSSSKAAHAVPALTTKRKRHESDSSNNSIEDTRNKKTRKCSENAAELIKACMGVDGVKMNHHAKKAAAPPTSVLSATAAANATGKLQDESSDSDEPLIEKVRKTTTAAASGAAATANSVGKKVKGGGQKGTVSTRRSVRTTMAPTPNTRSKGDTKVTTEASEALRRKTRSAVLEGDSKRKKEVK